MNQLYGKQKAQKKFPTLFDNPQVLYPVKVSIEQSSSEKTARFKTALLSGTSLMDMTGGFGIDSFFFAQQFKKVKYIEKNVTLFSIACHNFKALSADNITTLNTSSVDYLKETEEKFDWIYLDPARRDEYGNRKVSLSDYAPNVLELRTLLLEKAKHILIKTSPILDIKQAVRKLETIQKIIIIAVQNEVKELLFILGKTANEKMPITCVNLSKRGTAIYNSFLEDTPKPIAYAYPKTYIYEPNAAILKAGVFNAIGLDFGLEKLHSNTHLYTSEVLINDFPGRIFNCETVLAFNKKTIRPYLEDQKANITTRNFPYSVEQIKKKLKCKDGGNVYLFATMLKDEKMKILVCRKV